MRYLFVYGTLKRGKPLHYYLSNSRFLGEGVTLERYPMVVAPEGWYPYLLPLPGEGYRVKGEIYQIPDPLLRVLDRVEEAPDYYFRREIPVEVTAPAPGTPFRPGEVVEAVCYFKRDPIPYRQSELLQEF